jgi:hypothetical protein
MRSLALVLAIALPLGAHAENAKPMPPKELAAFLGPVSPTVIRWTKYAGEDFDVYHGRAMRPLIGEVGFYLGGWPDFKPEAGSTGVEGRLGIFPVKWYRTIASDRSVSQKALIRLDDYWQVDIWVSAKRQADVDRLVATVAQLPTFTKKPKPVGSQ